MAASGEADRRQPTAVIPVIVISGPTCSGKSSLAITMARQFGAEIISADSRQIFRQLKIGTDRLDEDEWQGVVHHLMGMVDLGERFTVFDFVRQAGETIESVSAGQRRVIVCGGTGLYIRALVDGIYEIPDEDMWYRHELLDLAAAHGAGYVYGMLMEIDPETAKDLHPHNLVRVIRALEIYHITGLKKSELTDLPTTKDDRFRFRQIILLPDRDALYQRIEERVDGMMARGLLEEVMRIRESSSRPALEKSKVVGYAELMSHLDGEISLDAAVNLIKQNTRRYAKRQYTWFRAVKRARVIRDFGEGADETCRGLIKTFWTDH